MPSRRRPSDEARRRPSDEARRRQTAIALAAELDSDQDEAAPEEAHEKRPRAPRTEEDEKNFRLEEIEHKINEATISRLMRFYWAVRHKQDAVERRRRIIRWFLVLVLLVQLSVWVFSWAGPRVGRGIMIQMERFVAYARARNEKKTPLVPGPGEVLLHFKDGTSVLVPGRAEPAPESRLD